MVTHEHMHACKDRPKTGCLQQLIAGKGIKVKYFCRQQYRPNRFLCVCLWKVEKCWLHGSWV